MPARPEALGADRLETVSTAERGLGPTGREARPRPALPTARTDPESLLSKRERAAMPPSSEVPGCEPQPVLVVIEGPQPDIAGEAQYAPDPAGAVVMVHMRGGPFPADRAHATLLRDPRRDVLLSQLIAQHQVPATDAAMPAPVARVRPRVVAGAAVGMQAIRRVLLRSELRSRLTLTAVRASPIAVGYQRTSPASVVQIAGLPPVVPLPGTASEALDAVTVPTITGLRIAMEPIGGLLGTAVPTHLLLDHRALVHQPPDQHKCAHIDRIACRSVSDREFLIDYSPPFCT